jgi:protein TonB
MILKSLPAYLRLSLFLLLSTGMHGGLVFYDWMDGADESGLSPAPLVVSLLPFAEPAPPVPAQSAQSVIAPPPALPPPQPPKNKPPRVRPKTAKPLPAAVPAKIPAKQMSQKKALPEVAQSERPDKSSTAQMVCMAPQEVASTSLPVTPPTVAGSPSIEPAALAETGPGTTSDSGVPAAQELIEAIPNYRSNPLPEYPFLARQRHWQGVVWLRVDVSMEGMVEDLRVEQSCGHTILDRAASRTVRQWRFTPARRAGQPTASQVRIPVRFQLEDS